MAAVMSGALIAEKRARKICWPAERAIHFTVLSITWASVTQVNRMMGACFSIRWGPSQIEGAL